MFDEIDIDKNGTIDYTEFVMATMNNKSVMTQDKLLEAFKLFDKDSSGTISADEIKEVLGGGSGMDESSIDKIIREVDENGDGEIQFEEFCHMMSKLADG